MRNQLQLKTICLLALGLLTFSSTSHSAGFVSLFDGKTLKGWTLVSQHGSGYGVTNGVIFCAEGGGGNLFNDKEFSDFILRLEFKLQPGGNNGVGIRAPLGGDAAYNGMEIQILDDKAPKHATIKPWQFNGSIYNVVPATNGTAKIGEWNTYEITAIGRHIKVVLNGKTITDANLNDVSDPETIEKHPGMLRDRGHIGFLGHNDYVEFRNIQIKELPKPEKENTPPEGFTALFNGKDLAGWKGLLARPNDNPSKRAQLSPEERAKEQAKADERMRDHWKAQNGEIVFDGKGDSLCTLKDYADFEMLVDWKIPPKGDSGVYVRGSPQVQIWEKNSPGQFNPPDGSGGLYNNQKNPRHPLLFADRPVGEWNRFRIVMTGEKVHVFLNGELVVRDTTLENYWDRDKPIYPSGQIELQNHGGQLWFKNIYIREIPQDKR
ncbi:MAG TPA: DUF1080 domain-containing protein [Candidatus Dormibacteraeota bacterium]|nr:DUF1080 domain-containing protein [Candidatus Dormibacteraeota bacterium]